MMRSTKEQVEERRSIIEDIIGSGSFSIRDIAQVYFSTKAVNPRQYWVILGAVKRMRDAGRVVKIGKFKDALWANA